MIAVEAEERRSPCLLSSRGVKEVVSFPLFSRIGPGRFVTILYGDNIRVWPTYSRRNLAFGLVRSSLLEVRRSL